MLKHVKFGSFAVEGIQPPSGGCVLKHGSLMFLHTNHRPAAFGRLCVETLLSAGGSVLNRPAAFGRLCVETSMQHSLSRENQPAAFGRLCVETSIALRAFSKRVPAAFGRLCVETLTITYALFGLLSSRLRAAVC